MRYCRRLIGCRDFDVRSRVYLLLYMSCYIVRVVRESDSENAISLQRIIYLFILQYDYCRNNGIASMLRVWVVYARVGRGEFVEAYRCDVSNNIIIIITYLPNTLSRRDAGYSTVCAKGFRFLFLFAYIIYN